MFQFGPGGFAAFPTVWGILGLVFFGLMVASVIWLIVVLVRRPGHWGWGGLPPTGGGWYGGHPYRSPALDELDVAYARGQLSREEYFRRRADLTGWSPPGGAPGFSGGRGPDAGSAPTPPATS